MLLNGKRIGTEESTAPHCGDRMRMGVLDEGSDAEDRKGQTKVTNKKTSLLGRIA
jgi:hypothetical protein